MSLTFGQLQEKALGWLGESSDQGVTRERVKDALDNANAQRASEYPWPFLIVDAENPIPLVAGQRDYAMPDDFWRVYVVYSQLQRKPLKEVASRDVTSFIRAYGTPSERRSGREYTIARANHVRLLWTPANGSDTLEVQYYRMPAPLIHDGDLPTIPYPHSRLLLYDALLDLTGFNTELELTPTWTARQQQHVSNLYAAYAMGTTSPEAMPMTIHLDDEDY